MKKMKIWAIYYTSLVDVAGDPARSKQLCGKDCLVIAETLQDAVCRACEEFETHDNDFQIHSVEFHSATVEGATFKGGKDLLICDSKSYRLDFDLSE